MFRSAIMTIFVVVACLAAAYGLVLAGPPSKQVSAGVPAGEVLPAKKPAQPAAQTRSLAEEKKVLAAAQLYMQRQGLRVGNRPGEIVLYLENLWGDRAVFLYGFAASEFFAELGMRRVSGCWTVTHDQARYFVYDAEKEPVNTLARAEGYVFGEEPGKYLVGAKDISGKRAVLLLAPYGDPWVWEYTLEKRQDSWVVVAKNLANEQWEPAADPVFETGTGSTGNT